MDGTTFNSRDIIKILKKRCWLILGSLCAFTLAAALISSAIDPVYEASTTVRIKQPKGLYGSLLTDGGSAGGNARQLMSTYAEIIKSRVVLQDVVDTTKAGRTNPISYGALARSITTQPVKDTDLLQIKVQSTSPAEAQLYANTLVDAFLKRMNTLVQGEQKAVREFISQRKEDAKKDLAQAESALEKYKREQKIIAPEIEIQSVAGRLSEANRLVVTNSVAMNTAQAKLQTANMQLGQQSYSEAADSPLIQQYKAKLADLELELVGLRQQYTANNAKVLAKQATIQATKEKLSTEINRVLTVSSASTNPIYVTALQSRIQAEVEIASLGAQRSAIEKILTDSDKDLSKLPARELGFIRVMRDVSVAQEIYIMLAKRHEEARISEVMQPTEVQIINPAYLPSYPIAPNNVRNTILGAVLGLLLGLGLAFGLELLNHTIRSASEVKTYLGIPVLGVIPDGESLAIEQNHFMQKLKQMFGNKEKYHRHNS